MKSQVQLKISARKAKTNLDRICQGDIFSDIEVIENLSIYGSEISLDKLYFPYSICLNQECDLENDYNLLDDPPKDQRLLHLIIAPVFNFESFLTGNHWDDIFLAGKSGKRSDTKIKLIMDNEIPRYHYLKFPEDEMPEFIIDFKHFFTVSRHQMYTNLSKRLCSIEDLFKEKISQRFSFYLSRIGLPENNSEET
jgi:hypothetical protein